MSKQKYTFTKQPKQGEHGEWKTADGFKCYTNDRATAVRWYTKYLKEQKRK